jgi:plasmid stabilization system protein ParE
MAKDHFHVRMHRLAEADMIAIALHIAQDSPANAQAFLTRIDACVDRLATHPNRCPLAPEASVLRQPIRRLLVPPARLYYMVNERTVIILRMRHVASDIADAKDFPIDT